MFWHQQVTCKNAVKYAKYMQSGSYVQQMNKMRQKRKLS
jgi:hypothetical protein